MKMTRGLVSLVVSGLLVAFAGHAATLEWVLVRDATLPPPVGGNGDSGAAVLSADGRYVLFASLADNLVTFSNAAPVSGLTPARQNVFLRDRLAQQTKLVSIAATGNAGGNEDSVPVAISTDGRFALFESRAGNLVPADTNQVGDVFLRDFALGSTLLISARTNGGSGNGESRSAAMTPDGRYIVFVSAANNLVAGDTNGIPDVFLRDRVWGTTLLVSAGSRSTGQTWAPAGSSESPELTPDGRFIAFYSSATNLVPGVVTAGEVYVRDFMLGTTYLASTNARALLLTYTGTNNGVACSPRISADGQYVAFVMATNPIAAAYSRGLALRHHLPTGNTEVIHTNAFVPYLLPEEIQALDVTPDGRWVAFVANTNISGSRAQCVYRWDGQSNMLTLVSQDRSNAVPAGTACDGVALEASGRYVLFTSTGTNLVTNTVASGPNAYLRDTVTGQTLLINQGTNAVGQAINAVTFPVLNANARVFAFDAPDGGVATNDNNGVGDVFVRDLTSGKTEWISRGDPSLDWLTPAGNSGFGPLAVSTDGRFVALASEASELVAGDTNGWRDIFVRDRWSGTTLLASVATNGVSGNGISTDATLSADGRYVAFASFASNLVAGDVNSCSDVFVRDLQGGVTTVASIATNGLVNGNGDSRYPVLSEDGRYVTFRSSARNLAAGVSSGENLFQRDRQAGVTRALTTAGVLSSAATPDGARVAFIGTNSGGTVGAYLWNTATASRIFTNTTLYLADITISPDGNSLALLSGTNPKTLRRYDLAANTNAVVALGTFPVRCGLQFSGDGRHLVFVTSTALAATDTNQRDDVYCFDAVLNTNVLVSRRFGAFGAAAGAAGAPTISRDGRYIAYRTWATNAVSGDANGAGDVLLFDRASDATLLISANAAGNATADRCSTAPGFSGDGRTLLFLSWATDLVAGDRNRAADVVALSWNDPLVDADADQLDDRWETNYFGGLERDGSEDFDADGASDGAEFLAGTNPTNEVSVFQATLDRGAFPVVRWPAAPFHSYRVQFKNDLADSGWQELSGGVTISGTNGVAADLAPSATQRFYRVELNRE